MYKRQRQDTAEFIDATLCEKQIGDTAFWQRNLQYCEEKIADFPQDSDIQRVRGYISDSCRQKAQEPAGIYQLNVPTGGGKTISALRYSLAHAEKYKKLSLIHIWCWSFLWKILFTLARGVMVIGTNMCWRRTITFLFLPTARSSPAPIK